MEEEGRESAFIRREGANSEKSSTATNTFGKIYKTKQIEEKIEQQTDEFGRSCDNFCEREGDREGLEEVHATGYDKFITRRTVETSHVTEVGPHGMREEKKQIGRTAEVAEDGGRAWEESTTDAVRGVDKDVNIEGSGEASWCLSSDVFRDVLENGGCNVRKEQLSSGNEQSFENGVESAQDSSKYRSKNNSDRHHAVSDVVEGDGGQQKLQREHICSVECEDHRKVVEDTKPIEAFVEKRGNSIPLERVKDGHLEDPNVDPTYNTSSSFTIHRRGDVKTESEQIQGKEVNVDLWPKLNTAVSGDNVYENDFIVKWVQRLNGWQDKTKVELLPRVDGLPSVESSTLPSESMHISTTAMRMKVPRLVSYRGREETFPLYTPKMLPLCVRTIEGFEDIKEKTLWLSNREEYEKLTRDVKKVERIRYSSNSMKKYVQQLIEAGIMRKRKPTEKIKSWCRMFAVPEVQKQRMRLIIEPRMLNDLVKPRLHEFGLRTYFASLDDIRRNVFEEESFLSYDYRCFYYQIPLAEEIQVYFGILIDGEEFVCCRLPMGFSPSVAIGNSISKAIVKEALKRASCSHLRTIVQVDNTYIFGTFHELQQVHASMLMVTKECIVSIGEQEQRTDGIILGVYYDLKQKIARLSEKFVTKHKDLLQAVLNENNAPVIVWWKVFAILLRVARVTQYSYSFMFHIFKGIRRIACEMANGNMEWTDELKWNEEAILEQLRHLHRRFIKNEDTKILVSRSEHNQVVFSDASNTHLGVVFAKSNEIEVYSREWKKCEVQRHINEKEAIALKTAIRMCVATVPVFICDSSCVVSACAKGLSRNGLINSVISCLKCKFPVAEVWWVRSEENPADGPSRNLPAPVQVRWDEIEPFDAKGVRKEFL